MNTDIYFYEVFEEEELMLRKYLPDNIKAEFTWKTIQETDHKSLPASIISTRTQSVFPQAWATGLKAIISRSTGYDHLLDYRSKTKAICALGYLPLYCNRAVAEQAMMMWSALARKLLKQMHQFSTFERDGLTGWELKGKTVAVYGVGNIGYEVVKIARGLEMEVFGVDIVQRHKDVNYISRDEGAKKADIIVSAMNLTSENVNYFNNDFFKTVKKNLIFVNISRGELSPVSEVLKALENKKIYGVAMDVFDDEKKLAVLLRNEASDKDDAQKSAIKKLMSMENVILTPHNAFNSHESVERKSAQTVEQLIFFLKNNRFIWSV